MDTLAFRAAMRAYVHTGGTEVFDEWNRAFLDESNIDKMIENGGIIVDAQDKFVRNMAKHAYRVTLDGSDLNGVACNASILQSELGAHLARGTTWACVFSQRGDGKWMLNFRSEKDGKMSLDVSKIAERYGGGGHVNAAGATVDDLPWAFGRKAC